MQFTVYVNQAKAHEWGLNASLSMLFAFVYEAPSWAKPVTTDNGVYFALSKQKIVDELPILTDKPDTAYRQLKQLEGKGLIEMSSTSSITLVRLTSKGKEWNKKHDGSEKYPSMKAAPSEKSPTDLGKISEPGSEKSPTNQGTSNQGTSNQELPCAPDDAPEADDAPVDDQLYCGDFNRFWNAYPSKKGKKPAAQKFKAVRKQNPSPEFLARLIEDVECRARGHEWIKSNGQFIPNASTYLNQERWNDPAPNVSQFKSRHVGFEENDYSEGLIEGVSDDAANF